MDSPTLSVFSGSTGWPKVRDGIEDVTPLVADLPYTNLQWNRRWFDVGQWSAVVPAEAFEGLGSPIDWAIRCSYMPPHYVMIADRITEQGRYYRGVYRNPTEMGLIQCVSYDETTDCYTLSGFFGEDVMNWGATTIPSIGSNQTPDYAWLYSFQDSDANACHNPMPVQYQTGPKLWDTYATPTYAPSNIKDKITWGVKDGFIYGAKAREWGEPRLLGVRVSLTKRSEDSWYVLAGYAAPFDLSVSQSKIAPKIFADSLGNLSNARVTYDYSNYRSCCLASYYRTNNSGNNTPAFMRLDRFSSGIVDSKFCFIDKWRDEPEEGQSYSDYVQSVRTEALSELAKYNEVITIEAESSGDDGYLREWDLGDIVTLHIKERAYSVQIVGVDEVYKNGAGTLSLTFGSRILSNIERAIRK